MEVSSIIAEIDSQIAKLQQARALLLGGDVAAPKPTRGRPKKSAIAAPPAAAASKLAGGNRKKRNLSADARKRIADAQKRRWAEKRKENA